MTEREPRHAVSLSVGSVGHPFGLRYEAAPEQRANAAEGLTRNLVQAGGG